MVHSSVQRGCHYYVSTARWIPSTSSICIYGRSILSLPYHLLLGIPSVPFLSRVHTETFHALLLHVMRAAYCDQLVLTLLTLLSHFTQSENCGTFICVFSPTSCLSTNRVISSVVESTNNAAGRLSSDMRTCSSALQARPLPCTQLHSAE